MTVRIVDIDDPPLDFNPTRQLRSAIIARGIYYSGQIGIDSEQKSMAVRFAQSMEKLEPPIIESIVAFFYRLIGSEVLWVSRIVSSTFWLIGAGALYDLGRRMTTPLASILGLSYFLFLPFGIQASRSFQPDPGMVMLILLSCWALFIWYQKRTWRWTLITGVFGGMTGLVKPIGLLFVGSMALGIFFYLIIKDDQHENNKAKGKSSILPNQLTNPQIWIVAILMILPLLFYYLIGIGEDTSNYFLNWTIFSRWRDVLNPSFFMRWMIRVDHLFNLVVVLAGLIGTLLASGGKRALLSGLWAGYFLLGLMFPYHILTHDYYHLPLLGLVSLALMPLLQTINDKIAEKGTGYQYTFVLIFLVFGLYNGWIGRTILLGNDFRNHPEFWQEVGDAIPSDSKVIGITQDYGFRLMYYGWRKIEIWPSGAGKEDFETTSQGAEYFLITAKNQLSVELAQYLETHYPVYAEGTGYVIYDLKGEK